MKPFRTFLARVRAWHLAAALTVTILLALTSHFAGPPIAGVAEWLFLLLAPPIMLFAMMVAAYAAFGRHDRVATLFPAVYVFTLLAIANPASHALRDPVEDSIGDIAVLIIILALNLTALFVASRRARSAFPN